MLSHAVSKVCIGITELVGNFLGEVSEIIEGDNPIDQSETTLRRSKRTKISEEDKDNVDETSLDSDYEEEEEYDDEDYESSQDNVSDEEEQDSGADEGRDVEDEELGQEGNPANDDGEKEPDDSEGNEEIEVPLVRRSRRSKVMESGHIEPHKEQIEVPPVLVQMEPSLTRIWNQGTVSINDNAEACPQPIAVIPNKNATSEDVRVDYQGKGLAKSRWPKLKLPETTGTSSNIATSNSWDFSPPDCNIMKFIDSGSQQGEAAVHFIEKGCMADCTEEVPEAKGLPLEQGSATHSWLDDLSSEELDKLLQDAERQRQVRIDESCSRNMNFHDKSVASIEKNIELSLIEDLQDRTPAPSVHEPPSGASISGTVTFELQPKRMYKVPAALRSPYIDYSSKNTFKCSKEICMVYNVVCRACGRSTRSSQSSSPEKYVIFIFHPPYSI